MLKGLLYFSRIQIWCCSASFGAEPGGECYCVRRRVCAVSLQSPFKEPLRCLLYLTCFLKNPSLLFMCPRLNLVKHTSGGFWGKKTFKKLLGVRAPGAGLSARIRSSGVGRRGLRAWPWTVPRRNRVREFVSRLSRHCKITALFIPFDLPGVCVSVLTKRCSPFFSGPPLRSTTWATLLFYRRHPYWCVTLMMYFCYRC